MTDHPRIPGQLITESPNDYARKVFKAGMEFAAKVVDCDDPECEVEKCGWMEMAAEIRQAMEKV